MRENKQRGRRILFCLLLLQYMVATNLYSLQKYSVKSLTLCRKSIYVDDSG